MMHAFIREHGIAITPDEVQTLQGAFDEAWKRLSANHLRPTDNVNAMRMMLAQEIFHLRERGERDPKRLANLAVVWISAVGM